MGCNAAVYAGSYVCNACKKFPHLEPQQTVATSMTPASHSPWPGPACITWRSSKQQMGGATFPTWCRGVSIHEFGIYWAQMFFTNVHWPPVLMLRWVVFCNCWIPGPSAVLKCNPTVHHACTGGVHMSSAVHFKLALLWQPAQVTCKWHTQHATTSFQLQCLHEWRPAATISQELGKPVYWSPAQNMWPWATSHIRITIQTSMQPKKQSTNVT
jgi:hypothetical protein